MSAELLKRAAMVLRKGADAATAGPWIASPVDSPDALVTSAVYSYAHPTGTPESEVVGATRKRGDRGQGIRRGNDARFIALMHPPVALALADLLDAMALVAGWHGLIDDYSPQAAAALARAVLRESDTTTAEPEVAA